MITILQTLYFEVEVATYRQIATFGRRADERGAFTCESDAGRTPQSGQVECSQCCRAPLDAAAAAADAAVSSAVASLPSNDRSLPFSSIVTRTAVNTALIPLAPNRHPGSPPFRGPLFRRLGLELGV